MKYYTPHIDELYIGLELEKQINGEWTTHVVESISFEDDIRNYRLGCLQPNDILEEEFQLISKKRDYIEFKKVIYSHETPVVITVRYFDRDADPVLKIFRDDDIAIDAMIIKNKSEFKWLISRLV